MDIDEPKIAVIFDQYGHPNQPFLTDWYLNLKHNDLFIQAFAADTGARSKNSGVLVVAKKGRIENYKSLLLALLNNRESLINVLRREGKYTAFKRLQYFAVFNSLFCSSLNIIHLLNAQQFIKFLPALDLLEVPIIVSFRGYETSVRTRSDKDWTGTIKKIYSRATFLHFVSDYLKEEAITLGAPRNKCKTIYRSVDTDFFSPVFKGKSDEVTRLISVGRLTWQKGYPYLLEAFKLVKESGKKFTYTIVGEGADLDHLIFHVRRLGLEKDVKFVGFKNREDLKDLLAQSDVFVQASLSDALPNSMLEASSMELPIIGTIAGGIPEAVKDGETGILVPIANMPAIANAVEKLIMDSPLRLKLGKNGRKFMLSDFSRKREVKEWLSVYNDASKTRNNYDESNL